MAKNTDNKPKTSVNIGEVVFQYLSTHCPKPTPAAMRMSICKAIPEYFKKSDECFFKDSIRYYFFGSL